MADLFKLAGRDVRVAEADNVLNTFEQISVVEASVQYNDNIEITEVYLKCEGMESSYRWSKIVFPAPGAYAASTVKYYYSYMGQKTELTPTNASDLNNALGYAGDYLMVSISNDASNPTITYLPHGMVLDRCYCSTDEGRTKITYYSYNALTGMPALHDIAPDTSTFFDKGTASTTATQTVYNPVELKKPLVAPAVKGEEFTISGGAQNTFALGGSITQESGKTLRQSQLILSGGTDSTLYKSGIVQDSNGYFFIIPKDSSNTANALWWVESNGGWRIGDNRIVTNDMLSNTSTTLQSHIKGQADDWIWLGKVAENVYTMDLSEIKPGASGTTTGATCYVSINTFRKRIKNKQLFKTVIDATCRCEPFELKHLDVKVLLSNVGSKWFMPRMFVSRGAMASDAFTHMMAVLYEDRVRVGMTVDECSIFRDMTTALGTLNASGSVSPVYGMNADGFTLFAAIMELDRDNENQNILVSGAHYRLTIFHPNTVL